MHGVLPSNYVADQFDRRIADSTNGWYGTGSPEISSTVKLEYNERPRDPKIVFVVDMWSLFKGNFVL